MDGALADVDWLQRDAGEVAIQLRASPTSIEGVHNVEVGSCILHKASVSAQEMPADKPPLLAMEPASQGAYCDSPPLRLSLQSSTQGRVSIDAFAFALIVQPDETLRDN